MSAMATGSTGRSAARGDGKPAVVLHGRPGSGCGPAWRRLFDRLDLSAPLDIPWMLAAWWDGRELVVIDDTGHTRGPTMAAALIATTDGFAHSHR
jgi:hypothetical protein